MRNVISQEQFRASKLFPTETANNFTLWHCVLMDQFEPPQLHLAAWRKAAGFTQEQLAEKIGYSRGYIAKSETQPQNVTLQFMSSFAEGVRAPSVPALFTDPDEFNPSLIELQRYFMLINEPGKRETLVDVAKGLSEQNDGSPTNT